MMINQQAKPTASLASMFVSLLPTAGQTPSSRPTPARQRRRGNLFGRLRKKKPSFAVAVATTAAEAKQDTAERDLNRYLAISSVTFALAAGGSIFFPPLIHLCPPGLIYVSIPIWKEAYQAIFKERRLRMIIVDAIIFPATIALGYMAPVSLGFTFYYVGKKLLLKTQDSSKKKLVNILGEQPQTVWVRTQDGVEVSLPFAALGSGDILIVQAGQMIPADGIIVDGMATIDERMLTGEAQPVAKQAGDTVLAATVVLQGSVDVRVKTTGAETTAAQIGRILEQTADYKSLVQSRGEELSDRLVLPLLGVSGLAWAAVSPAAAIVVLCAPIVNPLRLASPLSVLSFLQLGLDSGILIKDGRSLELLQDVDTVVFDKTGTLTQEQPSVVAVHPLGALAEQELLLLAAAAEQKQSHPIAQAILAEAEQRALALPPVEEVTYEVGFGLSVTVAGQMVQVGSQRFVERTNMTIPETFAGVQTRCNKQGGSLVYVAVDGVLAGAIELSSTIRPEVPAIINELRRRGLTTYIISGDREEPTRQLAEQLHIDHYFAETLPEDKANLIAQLQENGRKVCFIGDGINDSIALKKANVPVSISGATTIATDTAEIILMDGSLKQLILLFDLAAALDTNMKRNVAAGVIPTAFIIGGAFFLNIGLFAAISLYNLSVAASVGNAISPALQSNNDRSTI
ncbi:MAG: heavy metal translocating P-type ATPase [Chloroflexota bacterium]